MIEQMVMEPTEQLHFHGPEFSHSVVRVIESSRGCVGVCACGWESRPMRSAVIAEIMVNAHAWRPTP